MKRLLGQMLLEPRCEGSIVGGVSVLLTLLGNEKRGELWDKPPSPGATVVAENTITALIPYLANFVDILHNPPKVLLFFSNSKPNFFFFKYRNLRYGQQSAC